MSFYGITRVGTLLLLCGVLAAPVFLSACADSTSDNVNKMSTEAEQNQSVGTTSTANLSTELISGTDMFFDTVVTITLYGEDKQQYIDECFALLLP